MDCTQPWQHMLRIPRTRNISLIIKGGFVAHFFRKTPGGLHDHGLLCTFLYPVRGGASVHPHAIPRVVPIKLGAPSGTFRYCFRVHLLSSDSMPYSWNILHPLDPPNKVIQCAVNASSRVRSSGMQRMPAHICSETATRPLASRTTSTIQSIYLLALFSPFSVLSSAWWLVLLRIALLLLLPLLVQRSYPHPRDLMHSNHSVSQSLMAFNTVHIADHSSSSYHSCCYRCCHCH